MPIPGQSPGDHLVLIPLVGRTRMGVAAAENFCAFPSRTKQNRLQVFGVGQYRRQVGR